MSQSGLNAHGPSKTRAWNIKTRLPSKNEHYGPVIWAHSTYSKILQNIEGLDEGRGDPYWTRWEMKLLGAASKN